MKITITAWAGLLLLFLGLLVFFGALNSAGALTIPAVNGLSAMHGGIYALLGLGAVAAGREA